MPTLSASEYTQYLKYKAAAASPIRPDVQTRTNATLSQSVLNANILASQAAYVVTPQLTTIPTLNYVRAPPPNNVNQPSAKSTISWTSGTSGSVGSTTSSKFQQSGDLPTGFKGSQNTYTRLPQNAGWIQGAAATISSGPKRF